MNLLEKMNAEQFKKLLEYKELKPKEGEALVKVLTETDYVSQLKVCDAVDLCVVLDCADLDAFHFLFESFKSKP
jgi:hypothetical protein